MKPVDILIILVIAAIAGLAGYYIYKSKKSGKKCIGCPYAEKCAEGCSCKK